MTRRKFAGLDVVVENPAGSVRQWYDREGKTSGSVTMKHDYGFIDGHVGKDGEEVDCYLGPNEQAQFCYVVHQLKSPNFGHHDEDKVMLGFDSEASAKEAYLAHRNDGERAYGGMSAIKLDDFKSKLERRTGTGKIRHEVDMSMMFDVARGSDGKLRTGTWDRFTTWGSKYKDGMETRFDEETLQQMARNWIARGDKLAMDFNHQSSYASQNGQPAPALAWYDALAVVRGGQCLCFERLSDSGALSPPPAQDMSDGLWGYRCEVTPLGEELLPNFKYISPTFSPDGTDEQGNAIGYVIHAVAATNTPFQAGTGITFSGALHRRSMIMANYEKTVMAKLGLEAGADDEQVKAAYAKKLEEGRKMLEEGEPDSMKKMADEMEELAGHYEAAYQDEAPEDSPHVVMRKMAGRLAKLAAGDAPSEGKEAMEEEPAEKMEAPKEEEKMEDDAKMQAALRAEYSALANRLGVRLPEGASAKQMFDAISAATVPAAQIPTLVDARVKQAMMERDQNALKAETKLKAEALVSAAIEGGYPKEQRSALLNFASDPKSYAAAEAMVKPFLGTTGESALFQKLTASGAPLGVDPRKETASTKDRRIVRNELANFVIEGERFSNMAKEWADAKEGPVKLEIDSMLSDSEQSHAGYRLIAANRLLKAKRPDLWAAAEEQDL